MISLTAIICVLFSIGTISAQEMWGSRIITTPSGPEKEMKFAYETGNVFGVFEGEEYKDLTIEEGKDGEEGKCKVGDEVIGSPCSKSADLATISFDNVEKYKAFTIGKSEGKIPIVAAYMVPDCKFEETLTGKVDLKTSAPLTRFVKGQEEVELDFGLKPGDADDLESTLYRNGEVVCSWTGKKVKVNNLQSCKDLEPSADGELWIARVTFQKKDEFAKDNYMWTTPTSFLTVSVDWDNEGVAPEVAECKENGVTLIPTEPTPIPNDPNTSESTTSAGRKGQEYGAITLGTLALFAIAKLF